jgi:hypothetical protein
MIMTKTLRAAAAGLFVLALSGCAGVAGIADAVNSLGTATADALLSVPRLTCPVSAAPPAAPASTSPN